MAKKASITVQLKNGEFITLDYSKINICEFQLAWGLRSFPGIKISMKDGTDYMVTYATQFKDIYTEMKKHKIPWIE